MALSNTTECKPASPSALCPPNPAIETAQHVQRQVDSVTMTWHTRDVDGLDRSFTVTATVAYVDTIALFHPGMFPSDQLSWLRTRFGRRMILESCKGPGNAFCGGLITLHQPDVETLERLIAIPKKQFVLSAAHIAVDFICFDQGQAKLAAELLGRATVQKWHRRNHHSHREKNTHYLRRGGSTRNIAVYGARDPAAMSRCDLPVQTPVGARDLI